MYHTAVHRDGLTKDSFDQVRSIRMLHGRYSPLRQSKVDGFGEVQGNRRGIAEVYGYSW